MMNIKMKHCKSKFIRKDFRVNDRPHILLGVTGSVAAIKFLELKQSLEDIGELKIACTKSALHFIPTPLPENCYTDEIEWNSWKKIGDPVLHIDISKWADIFVIAPLSANTLAKMANGMCDNLVTCIFRAWKISKPIVFAPAMNTVMWENPFTDKHIQEILKLEATMVDPISKLLACGDTGMGAMALPSDIAHVVRQVLNK